MNYHIDTGLIYEKFNGESECPLCEIEKLIEEQLLNEYLNDAVMDDDCRIMVSNLGFCEKHFDMLFNRPNKLSVALQIESRIDKIHDDVKEISKISEAKKVVKSINAHMQTCIICKHLSESMEKYYKTVAQMFTRENEFYKTLLSTKGFCLKHYSNLLKYAKYAGFGAKDYISLLSELEERNFDRIKDDINAFKQKHDYRNRNNPLAGGENALPETREKLYGIKRD